MDITTIYIQKPICKSYINLHRTLSDFYGNPYAIFPQKNHSEISLWLFRKLSQNSSGNLSAIPKKFPEEFLEEFMKDIRMIPMLLPQEYHNNSRYNPIKTFGSICEWYLDHLVFLESQKVLQKSRNNSRKKSGSILQWYYELWISGRILGKRSSENLFQEFAGDSLHEFSREHSLEIPPRNPPRIISKNFYGDFIQESLKGFHSDIFP